ncbi:uncharacterized protein LOC124258164 [Haliotis rubra]|uniref:uncharacterized protein LOC124258164 n=1 Tax=Haliotis rubra TaxID=36100 RepID=UPI001EE5843A|nr:uncharacterized protein LOC124258164 [Haliotis rubra]
MNPANVRFPYYLWVNGSVAVRLLLVNPMSHKVTVLNSSHTGYTTRMRYTGEDSLSQTGQLRFTIYNVTVQDAGTYYCQESIGQIISGCGQVLVVAQEPTPPTITGPASPVSGENVTLTCSSSSRSLPLDHPPLTLTYIWRRNRTLLESGDGSSTGRDDLTITHISRENHGDIYSCQAVEEGLKSDWSHGHVLDVLSREVTESGAVSIVPVAAVCSVLIVVIAVVVIVVVCRKQRRGGWGDIHSRLVTYILDAETDGGYQEIEERGYVHQREDENDGNYQEIEEDDDNVDDIVPIVAVYSIMLTAVAVVVAAVTILVCKDVKENQDRRCGEYLTVMADRLSRDFSDVPCASNNDGDVLPLHDYERLLREQFHIYTSLHPSTS